MSLQLMRERVKHSGSTAREEMIIDGQNLLKEELEHDSSYSPTMYFWNPVLGCDDRPAKVRIYKRKYSSLNVNDVHYEGKMIQCNYLLRWQLANGEIIERYSNIVSASKYDVGETGNSTLVLSSNNYTILIGYCDEGFELEGKRVFIDMKPIKPTKVFKITRSDDVLYNSGSMGSLLSFIADKVEFNPNADNQELRICDYNSTTPLLPTPSEPNETTDLRCVISGNTNLKNGYRRMYTVTFTDIDGNAVDWQDVNYQWNVQSDFDIKQTISDNKITISVNDENLIGGSFLVQIVVGETVLSEIKVNIVE